MSKKEARNIAAKNKRMKDWVRKVSTPTRSMVSDMEQGDLEIAPDMEWEDALDIEKAWRLAIAKEKTESSRRRFLNKVIVMEMVESTSVVGGVIDNLIEASSLMGEVNVVWKQMDNNKVLKEAIMMKLEQEDRNNTMLLEYQIREERLEKVGTCKKGLERGKKQQQYIVTY